MSSTVWCVAAVVTLFLQPTCAGADMRDEGTLVVAIPSNGGLVVASDSRLSVEATFCDGVEKFLEPASPEHLLMFVTGRRGFWPISISAAPDPCVFVKNNAREFDFGQTAMAYVERENRSAAQLDMKSLADHCMDALRAYLATHPYRLNGMSIATSLTLASYDVADSTYRIRTVKFDVDLVPRGKMAAGLILDAKGSGPDELADPYVFGELDYYQRYVHDRMKDEAIYAATRRFLAAAQKVGVTSPQDAADRAADMIQAASRRTLEVPAPSGIGGPVAVRLVGTAARPAKLVVSPLQ